MTENLFDPTIHQSAEPLAGYRFEHEALVERLNELKKAPSEKMKAFLAAHPEYKNFNGSVLAEYSGLSEPTLKKLKSGQIADPRGSTFWILFNKFGIRPREVLKCIPPNICDVECANQARHKLEEVAQQNAKLEAQHAADQEELSRLRRLVLEHSNAAAKAQAETSAMQNASKESEARISRRDQGIRVRNRIILALLLFIALLFLADLLLSSVGWFRFGPM